MSTITAGLLATWKIVWRVGLFFIGWGMLLLLFLAPYRSKLGEWERSSPLEAGIYNELSAAITILAITWILVRFIDKRPLRTIGLAFNHVGRDLFAGLALGTAWLGVSLALAWICGWASFLAPVGFSWPILGLISISMLLNVFTQEMLLCGFIFQTIRSKSNVMTAVIISAILFSSYHAPAFRGEWLPAVNVFGAGILFCLAYMLTNNLWFPIAMHFAWDVLMGPVLGLTESGLSNLGGGWKLFVLDGPSFMVGGTFGVEGGFIVTMTIVMMIVLVNIFRRKKFLTEPASDPNQ
jgi:uncharacterized protein